MKYITTAIYAFVIKVLGLIIAIRSPNFGEKYGTHFFTKCSMSKNNLKPKHKLQQANLTVAQHLTMVPLLLTLHVRLDYALTRLEVLFLFF